MNNELLSSTPRLKKKTYEETLSLTSQSRRLKLIQLNLSSPADCLCSSVTWKDFSTLSTGYAFGEGENVSEAWMWFGLKNWLEVNMYVRTYVQTRYQ